MTGKLTIGIVAALTLALLPAAAVAQDAASAPTTQPDEAVIAVPPSVMNVSPQAGTPAETGEPAPDQPAEDAPPGPDDQTVKDATDPGAMMEDLLGPAGDGDAPARSSDEAEGVRDEMLPKDSGRARRVVPGVPGVGSSNESVEPVDPQATSKLKPEGYIEIDRLGALKPDRGRWLFVFEADKSSLADPPMVLVPNSLLEAMQKQSDNGRRPVKFRVTGEVTQYRGTNYLMLRKVLIEHPMDRL